MSQGCGPDLCSDLRSSRACVLAQRKITTDPAKSAAARCDFAEIGLVSGAVGKEACPCHACSPVLMLLAQRPLRPRSALAGLARARARPWPFIVALQVGAWEALRLTNWGL